MKQKIYINLNTDYDTASASIAKEWLEHGDDIHVLDPFTNERIFVNGKKRITAQEKTDRENWKHCKRISDELDCYVDGNYAYCPYCNETVYIPDTVGDKFKCYHCGTVDDVERYDALGLWDYMQDVLDIDFIVNSRKEYSACRVCVAYGGPSIYIDTERGAVCLYWWTDTARYYLRSETVDAVNDWAEDYYNCL